MSHNFADKLKFGQVGESVIADWFKRKGYMVLPVYETEFDTGKGPRVFSGNGNIIAPDMLIFKANNTFWVEAKHKGAFSWYRIGAHWTTGIDLKHYEDYKRIDDLTDWPVWLLFLQRGGQAKDSPGNSPAGLFGNSLDVLRTCESHRSMNWGKWGMVYWNIKSLRLLATMQELEVAL